VSCAIPGLPGVGGGYTRDVASLQQYLLGEMGGACQAYWDTLIPSEMTMASASAPPLSSAGWAQNALTLSAPLPDVTHPEGSEVRKLTESVGSATHYLKTTAVYTAAIAVPCTISVDVKYAGRKFVQIYCGGYAFLDLTTGALGTAAACRSATAVNLGDGWYRLTVAANQADTNYFDLLLAAADNTAAYVGDGSSGIYIANVRLVQNAVSQWNDLSINENGARRNRHSTQSTATRRLVYESGSEGTFLYGSTAGSHAMVLHSDMFSVMAGDDPSFIWVYDSEVVLSGGRYYESLAIETLSPGNSEIPFREYYAQNSSYRFSGGPVSVNVVDYTPAWKVRMVRVEGTQRKFFRDANLIDTKTLDAPSLAFSGTKYGYHLGDGYGGAVPQDKTRWQALFKPPAGVSMATLDAQVRQFINKRRALTGQAAQGW
jgi:hypothetical protein